MNAEQEYQNVAPACLKESPMNPRRTFDKKAMEDLEQSVREAGRIITPLIVAPNGTGETFEILAGARRWRVATELGLETVPVRVLEGLSEHQKLEIMLIENLQRADVHPLEEAQSYSILMKSAECDVAAIAKKVGKSEKYVYDRVKLLELAPACRKYFEAGRMNAGHAIILARCEPAEQLEMVKLFASHRELSVRGLEEQITWARQRKKYEAEEKAARKKIDVTQAKANLESRPGEDPYRRQQKLKEKKNAAETVARQKTLAATAAKVKTLSVDDLRIIVRGYLDEMVQDSKCVLLKHLGIEPIRTKHQFGSSINYEKPIAALLPGANEAELSALLMQCALINSTVIGNWTAKPPTELNEAAKRYGVKPFKAEAVALKKSKKPKPRNKKKVVQTSAKKRAPSKRGTNTKKEAVA